MLVLMVCAALLVLLGCPETPTGKALKAGLVDWPARMLSALTPAVIALTLAVILASALIVALFETEGARLLGMALPEGMAWFATFDVATVLDLFAATAMISAVARLRGFADQTRALMRRTRVAMVSVVRRTGRARQSARRPRRPVSRPGPDCDGEGGRRPGSLAWA